MQMLESKVNGQSDKMKVKAKAKKGSELKVRNQITLWADPKKSEFQIGLWAELNAQ
jgi:hypothetical protein